MSLRTIKKAPIVRLPPKSNFEIFFSRMSQVATVVVGLVTFIFALKMGEYILAPISLGIVIGLMLGPVATKLEYKGVRPGLSAFLVVMLFIIVVSLFALAVAAPLSYWIERLPQIWVDLQRQLADLKGPFEALKGMRGQLREITGGDGLAVSVDDGMGVESIAMLAPSLIGQILLFFASLYFFVATRHETRATVLSLCFSRRLRWRVAHIFRDVEHVISKYLLSITIINILEGLAVGIALYLIGIPSAPLWGAIAILTNFVVFIGPAVMVVILFAIGLTEFDWRKHDPGAGLSHHQHHRGAVRDADGDRAHDDAQSVHGPALAGILDMAVGRAWRLYRRASAPDRLRDHPQHHPGGRLAG